MTYVFEIIEYDIEIPKKYSNFGDVIAFIRCFMSEGHVLHIAFFPPCLASGISNFFLWPSLPEVYPPETYIAFLCLSSEKYVWVLDLLRNEKPVFAYLDPEALDYMRIFSR